MTDTVTAKLAEWEALTEGATPGPWEAPGDGDPYLRWGDVATRGEPGNRVVVCERAGPDAEFIAAAPTIARALLGFVREVRAEASDNISPDYRGDAYDQGWQEGRDAMTAEIERAARKWLGGED